MSPGAKGHFRSEFKAPRVNNAYTGKLIRLSRAAEMAARVIAAKEILFHRSFPVGTQVYWHRAGHNQVGIVCDHGLSDTLWAMNTHTAKRVEITLFDMLQWLELLPKDREVRHGQAKIRR